jgi:DoxX-like protein
MSVVAGVLSILLAAGMAMTAARKAHPDKRSIALRDRLGVPGRLWAAVGVPEALAAVGLVAGLWWPALGLAAAVGVVLLMIGAVAFHLRARFFGSALVPPSCVLAVAVATAVSRAVAA